MKSVLINGASPRSGKATAKLFAAKDWCVFAKVRKPEDFGGNAPNTTTALRFNATKAEDISGCVNRGYWAKRRDTIVNSAGYGSFGAVELSTD